MYKVFFNPDCQMYGVQKKITDYMGTRWTQVLPPKKSYGARNGQSAYTVYKAVAERWVKELQA
jgi:hypothetical protein